MTASSKADARRRALAARDAVPAVERAAAGASVAARVAALPEWVSARTVLAYVAIGSEVDTRPLVARALADGKRVCVPLTHAVDRRLTFHAVDDPASLAPGTFRIPEPDPALHPLVPANEVDVACVPGVAFDRRGHRIGYGHGYFDRALGAVGGVKVGVSYARLLVDTLPADAHDVPVDVIVTERETLRVRGPA